MNRGITSILLFVFFIVSAGAYPVSDEIRSLPMKIESISKSMSLENRDQALSRRDVDFIDGTYDDIKYVIGVYESLEDMFKSTVPKEAFQGVSEFFEYWKGVFNSDVWKLTYPKITELVKRGRGVQYILSNFGKKINSVNNTNIEEPKFKIYPSSDKKDAPYTLKERELRSAIYIPSTFEYGEGDKKIVLLAPGTGSFGGNAFHSNYIKLLNESDFADPVWLNIPNHLMNDAQSNAEYVAYAVNYISSISDDNNISIVSWSQGGLDVQWALKYWPSIRKHVSNFIPISPDFHGTKIAYALCPNYPKISCSPSVLQQKYDSLFIKTLRGDGGDSAYVPTTSIYSGFDEVVEPQSGKNASAFLRDIRNVGVENFELQKVCPNATAGRFYTHEGALYNPIGYALAADAIKNGGPGNRSGINVESLCGKVFAEGLNEDDLATTEVELLYALYYLLFLNKVKDEPEIKKYAQH